MKKGIFRTAVVLTLASSLFLSSCIGSFGLTGKVYEFNKGVGNKFVNELVFLAMCIIPVYEVTLFIDAIVLNSIEFWTGNNPIAAGQVKQVKGENGEEYTITTLENGYEIKNEEGKEMSLIYDKKSNVWSSVVGDKTNKLIQIQDNGTAIVYLPNGTQTEVQLDQRGVASLKQVIDNQTVLFAAK